MYVCMYVCMYVYVCVCVCVCACCVSVSMYCSCKPKILTTNTVYNYVQQEILEIVSESR